MNALHHSSAVVSLCVCVCDEWVANCKALYPLRKKKHYTSTAHLSFIAINKLLNNSVAWSSFEQQQPVYNIPFKYEPLPPCWHVNYESEGFTVTQVKKNFWNSMIIGPWRKDRKVLPLEVTAFSSNLCCFRGIYSVRAAAMEKTDIHEGDRNPPPTDRAQEATQYVHRFYILCEGFMCRWQILLFWGGYVKSSQGHLVGLGWIFQQLPARLPWNLIQAFVVSRGWILMISSDLLTFLPLPHSGWNLSLVRLYQNLTGRLAGKLPSASWFMEDCTQDIYFFNWQAAMIFGEHFIGYKHYIFYPKALVRVITNKYVHAI